MGERKAVVSKFRISSGSYNPTCEGRLDEEVLKKLWLMA